MNTDTKEITTVEQLPAQAEAQSDGAVMINIIQEMCSKPDFDPEKMQQIINMRKEMFLEQARIVFGQAMARVQGLIQPVIADADNLQTGSRYAKLNAIVKALAPVYTAEGFTVSYNTEPCPVERLSSDGWFRVTSELNHAGGYTKNYHVDLPLDVTGPKGNVNKTAMHGTKSAISYARVILMGLMFNFTTSLDIDDDGNAAGAEKRKKAKAKRKPQNPASIEQLAALKIHLKSGKLSPRDVEYITANLDRMTKLDAAGILDTLKKEQSA